MATVYLKCRSQRVLIQDHGGQFATVLSAVNSLLGFRPSQLQYSDEDGDLITVESQFDFQEALKFAQATEEITFQLLAEMDQLPLVQSQVIDPPSPPSIAEPSETIEPVSQQNDPPLKPEPLPVVPAEEKIQLVEVTAQPSVPIPEQVLPLPIPQDLPLKEELIAIWPSAPQPRPSPSPQGFDPLLIQSIIDEELQSLFPARQSLMRSQLAAKSVHVGVKCSECKVMPIRGARFRCERCGLEWCEDCEEKQEHEHVLVKYRLPVRQQVQRPQPVSQPVQPAKPVKQPVQPGKSVVPPMTNLKIKQIMDMGFSYDQAVTALEVCQGKVDEAINQLLG